jgi:hypothetical protein
MFVFQKPFIVPGRAGGVTAGPLEHRLGLPRSFLLKNSSMASSSSTTTNPLLGHVISKKLSKGNHLLWKAQVLHIMRGARLEGFLTGASKTSEEFIVTKDGDKEVKNDNPTYEIWVALDQQVIGILLSSLTREVIQQVATSKKCDRCMAEWQTIELAYGSQTRVRAVNTHLALVTTHKGNMSVTEYVTKIRALGDEMASAGKSLDDEELVSCILAGLDAEYNSVVSTVVARVEPITVSELYG